MLDLTFEQIEIVERAVRANQIEHLNLMLDPLIQVQRGKWKGYRLEGEKPRDTVSLAKDGGDALAALAAAGFTIKDE